MKKSNVVENLEQSGAGKGSDPGMPGSVPIT